MTKKEILKEIIRDFHKGELPETRRRDITIPVNSGKIVTLCGVRRSGKTFMLYETIKKLYLERIQKERILYINFEDERLELKSDELDLILQAYRELYPDFNLIECYFFFDEVQNIQNWERFIRRIYDTVTRNIFITGSNSRLLSKEIATQLRGRTVTIEIFPLSFREYLRFHNMEIDLYHSKSRAKIVSLFEGFLFEGGFPEIAAIKDAFVRSKVLQGYFDVMLYRDLIERFNITNIPGLKYFIKRIFENITSPVSVNRLYNELKSQGYRIGKNYLYEFLESAEAVYLFLTVKKCSESVLKQELGEKKVYVIDNGLLNSVTFKFSKDYGKLLENLVFLEFIKRGENLCFYKNKKECDFVTFEGSSIKEIIQVSYSLSDLTTRTREIEGLISAFERFGIKEGRIVTFSEEEDIKLKGIWIKIVPAFKFFLGDVS